MKDEISLEQALQIEADIRRAEDQARKYWQVDFARTGTDGKPLIFETVKHDITDILGKAAAPTPLLWIEDKAYS